MKNKELEIAKEASEIHLKDMTGTLTIDDALRQAERNLNKLNGLHQIIKCLRGEDDET